MSTKEIVFDPDELHLDKEMIIKITRAIRKKWHKQNPNADKNSQMISILETTEGFIEFTDIEVMEFLYKTMAQLVFEIMKLNALHRNSKDFNTKSLYDIAIKNLEDGNF